MTERTFLKHLRNLKNGWQVQANGHLRMTVKKYKYCPVTAVCKAKADSRWNTNQWENAADELGLEQDFALNVMLASDVAGWPQLRNRLLKAVGLEARTRSLRRRD